VVTRTALGVAFLALGMAACGGRARSHSDATPLTPPEEEPDAGPPVSCAGMLDATPTVLRSDLMEGFLLLGQDRLILVESEGRVVSIERCTGDVTELANGLGRVSSAVIAGAYVWVASGAPNVVLRRIGLASGQGEVVLGSPYGSLVADDSHVSFLERPDGGAMVAVSVSASSAMTLSRRPLGQEYVLRARAAGPAGLYFSQDCDCAGVLRRLPPDSSALVAIEGAGPSSVSDYYSSVLAHDGSLYVALNPKWLRRLPPEGGEFETLLPSARAQSLSAAGDALCWSEGTPYGASSVHCASLATPTFDAREVDRVETGGMRTVVTASDAVYWLRGTSLDFSLPLELVAAGF
jgi:hypothetical protein